LFFKISSFAAHALEKLPTGRLGEVEEIANLASYMLSDYSSWMTGEVSSNNLKSINLNNYSVFG